MNFDIVTPCCGASFYVDTYSDGEVYDIECWDCECKWYGHGASKFKCPKHENHFVTRTVFKENL